MSWRTNRLSYSSSIIANTYETGQKTANASGIQLAPARPGRVSLSVKNMSSSVAVFIGTTGVTASGDAGGFELDPTEGKTFRHTQEIRAITASGTALVCFDEEYNS